MEQDRKAVLAALLAVKKGFVSPDEAMHILAEIDDPNAQPADSQAPAQPTPEKSIAQSLCDDGTSATAFEDEIEAIANDPIIMANTLNELGINEDAQKTLFTADSQRNLSGDTQQELVRKTLCEIAPSDAPTMRYAAKTQRPARRIPPLEDDTRYDVKREYARGGMGRIMIALDRTVGREVALKELIPSDSLSGSAISPFTPHSVPEVAAERFLREARITGKLEHPNIVPVYEVGERPNGSLYYTMKFVRGRTMAERLHEINEDNSLSDDARLSLRLQLLDSFVDICNAIAYSHSRGIVHRDLKPHNVIVGEFGETVLIDWGLAHIKGQRDEAAERMRKDVVSLVQDESDSKLTLDGAVLGTPAYMPPEQAKGLIEEVDELSDVYALGAILYEILAGRSPYEGGTARTVLAQVLDHAPKPVSHFVKNIPPELAAVVSKAMARDKKERFESAKELAEEIRAFRDGRALKAYNYSSVEMIKRFVGRNKAAVLVGLLATLALITGGVLSYANILSEKKEAERQQGIAEAARVDAVAARKEADANATKARDNEQLATEQRDKANEALAKYDQEREAKEALLREQQQEYDEAVAARKEEIDARLLVLDQPETETIVSDVAERIRLQNEAQSTELTLQDKTLNDSALRQFLELISEQESLVALYKEPVAGEAPKFIPAEEIAQAQERLVSWQLQAIELAKINEDFALAEVLLNNSALSDTALIEKTQSSIAEARVARLKRNRKAILNALDDVRKGLGRPGRAAGAPRIDDYVIKLSGYREHQTLEIFKEALEPYIKRLEKDGWSATFTQAERDELKLIAEVCGRLELGEACVRVLSPVMDLIFDQRIATDFGIALCNTRHPSAYKVLTSARTRLSDQSSAWKYIRFYFPRVPPTISAGQPQTAHDYYVRALEYQDTRRFDEALADLSEAISREPDEYYLWLARGNIYREQGKHTEALQDYDTVIRIQPDMATGYIHRGLTYWDGGQRQKALADMDKAIEIESWSSFAYANRGFMYMMLQDYDQALNDLDVATSYDSSFTSAFYNRGVVNLQLERVTLAEQDFNKVIELDPFYVNAYLNRANIQIQKENYTAAIDDLNRCVELAPGNITAYYNRAIVYSRKNETRQALEDFNQCVVLDPTYIDAYLQRSYLYRTLYENESALAECNRALETIPENPDLLVERGRVHEANGSLDLAVLDFGHAIRVAPQHVGAYLNRARVRRDNNELGAAIDDYSKALDIDPTNVEALTSRASTYREQGEADKALADLNQALTHHPTNGSVLYRRGLYFRDTGDRERALEDWRQSIEVDPNGADRYSVEFEISQLEEEMLQETLLDREATNTEERYLKVQAHCDKAMELLQMDPAAAEIALQLRKAKKEMLMLDQEIPVEQREDDWNYSDARWQFENALSTCGYHMEALERAMLDKQDPNQGPNYYALFTQALHKARLLIQFQNHEVKLLRASPEEASAEAATLNTLDDAALADKIATQRDEILTMLEQVADNAWYTRDEFENEPGFKILEADPRWAQILDKLSGNDG